MSLAGDHERAESAIARAARGDREAFTEIVALHHPSMLRLSYLICGDRDLAHDAVQNAWQQAWRKLGSLQDETKLRAWLLRVTGNEARQAARKVRGRRDREAALGRHDAHESASREGALDLQAALGRLRPEDRELLALRYVLGLTSPEIARHLGISPEGVRTRNKRLIDRLRGELTDG